jgi:hypothetical protein
MRRDCPNSAGNLTPGRVAPGGPVAEALASDLGGPVPSGPGGYRPPDVHVPEGSSK